MSIKPLQISVFFFSVLLLVVESQRFPKITHTTDPDAVCLDGSPPALYISEGSEKNKVIIFLEGGGYCYGQSLSEVIEDCYQRSQTFLGSSTKWPDFLDAEGYLSNVPGESEYRNWTKIILAYCDGAFHQGHREQPIKYKGTNLFFRGEKVLKSHLKYLSNRFNISEWARLIWTGSSAGAIGAYLWSGYIRETFQKTDITFIIDSGILLDFPAFSDNKSLFSNALKNLYQVTNNEKSTPFETCNSFMESGEEWKCFFLQYSYQYLIGKFFYISSQYDSKAIQNVLKIDCLIESKITTGFIMSKCSKVELDYIEKYRKEYMMLMYKLAEISQSNSIWSIGCSNHVFACLRGTYDSENWRVPAGGPTLRNVLESNERILAIDPLGYPGGNPNCEV